MSNVELYQQEFIRFREQLRSYLYRLVAHKEVAEDLTQDTYIRAFQKLDGFKGDSSFKTWTFAIATNLAKDHHRFNERWGENWMDLVRDAHVADPSLFERKKSIVENSPHVKFVLSEHLNYCFNCTSKTLLPHQQVCLWLKEVYDFKITEIMLITDLSEGKVKHAISDARKHLTRIFEKKCALINQEGTCSQCTGLNKMYNPKQNEQEEANKLKMVKEREKYNHEKLLDLRLQLVKGIDPYNGMSFELHNYLIENSPDWAKHQSKLKER